MLCQVIWKYHDHGLLLICLFRLSFCRPVLLSYSGCHMYCVTFAFIVHNDQFIMAKKWFISSLTSISPCCCCILNAVMSAVTSSSWGWQCSLTCSAGGGLRLIIQSWIHLNITSTSYCSFSVYSCLPLVVRWTVQVAGRCYVTYSARLRVHYVAVIACLSWFLCAGNCTY